MRILHQIVNTALLLLTVIYMQAQNMLDLHAQIDKEAAAMNEQVIQWRHHFHQYPELSNREFKTADAIAEYLTNMGYQVDRSFAKTGVVAVLDSGKPGPTVGLRADIDALPVTERTPIPFASKETSTYLGQEVGVMHACGHDTHISMLLGTAAILKDMKDQLRGKVVFVFQPAEEGAPPGEEGGAGLMVKEGLLEKYGIQVMFGQHIGSGLDVGKLVYKSGGMLAAADVFNIKVTGKQTHGSQPWSGIDPITVSAQIIMGLQTIISRQTELTKEAAVITVGKITGGVRNNIIPETCEMTGTIRTLDTTMQRIIHEKIRLTATKIAESAGAKADVEITIGVPVTYNDPNLTQMMVPSLQAAAGGADNVLVTQARTGAEDFSFFAEKVPSLFWSTGGKPLDTPPGYAAPHHTPDFFIDESGMQTGVKAMCYVTVDYLFHQGVVKP
ncbi:MAG TPA: amidohydrolase [Saprospiraceae bacterium]|nr:amidohydrolase [Lewinellaceae bacterium]HPG06978.1 amidohydrolase [Saprospiraceae bacterium]HPQ98486.1 amidohydrolase [Saprospiraceae bacterium]HQU53438.1 amidohydrolase [Saprospiraceae bacterium]HRV85323.1 amidohydrolase [Saprospiraceae bacterium]